VIGAHNQMAASAAQAIAAKPGEAYNPFFVYGKV
jgi:chromosomal replication initiation ATPase DnaA